MRCASKVVRDNTKPEGPAEPSVPEEILQYHTNAAVADISSALGWYYWNLGFSIVL